MKSSKPHTPPSPDPELSALRSRWAQEYRLMSPKSDGDADWEMRAERLSEQWLRIPVEHPRTEPKKSPLLLKLWPVWTAAAVLLIGWGAFRNGTYSQTPLDPPSPHLDWAAVDHIGTEALLLELDPAILLYEANEVDLNEESFGSWDLEPEEIESLQWNDAGLLLYEM